MVARRDERITRFALGSANPGGRLKSGDDAPQLVEVISVAAIDPDPDQPRRHFDAIKLQELADSLHAVGQLQPVILIRRGERYQLHVGERRWRAAQLAGLAFVRAIVRATPLEARATRIAQIVENEQRDDLTTTDLIAAVAHLHADGFKSVEIATALSKPKSRISELAALAAAPAELLAVADAIGLSLSYQLLRQYRAQPAAALDFLRQMPVEHISRITIATIAQAAAHPLPDVGEGGSAPTSAAADDGADRTGAGKGTSPRGHVEIALADARPAPASDRSELDARPAAPTMIGTLVIEHDEHGPGAVVFGPDVPPDHLAISFAGATPIVLHKADIRLLRTVAQGLGSI